MSHRDPRGSVAGLDYGMARTFAVIRTLFLVFIIIYTLATAPIALWDSSTATVTIEALRRLQRATWIAIAWIGFETLLGWVVVSFRKPRPATPPRRSAEQPPPAAPSPRM